jgi:hypothetical protein
MAVRGSELRLGYRQTKDHGPCPYSLTQILQKEKKILSKCVRTIPDSRAILK